MRLTPAAELAVRGALVLAENYGNGPVSIAKVCEIRQLGKEYLTKIFSSLSKAGLVTPIRGKGGGYILARDPAEINLLEIVEAIEGPLALNFCQQDPPRCHEEDCPVREIWSELQETVRARLASVRLADCCTGKRSLQVQR